MARIRGVTVTMRGMKVLCFITSLIGVSFTLSGCAALRELDRDDLNRPGMDLQTRRTPALRSALSPFGSGARGSGGGACTTCVR